MHCPFCNHEDTKVTDSRLAGEGHQIRRRRECLACGERFTTFESAELTMPQVVKNDRTRQPFDEGKLRGGIMKALEKRPVGREQVDTAIERIGHRLRALGEREVPSRVVGEIVMEELRLLDEVAYVRFASVYHHFRDADEALLAVSEKPGRKRRREPASGQMSLLPAAGRDPRERK